MLLLGVVALIQWLVLKLGEPKLFDIIPLGYIFDSMDLAILIAFIVLGTLEAVMVFRNKVMRNTLWLHPLHLRFLLKYYVAFVLVLGFVIFLGALIVLSGDWTAIVSSLSFILGVITGIISKIFRVFERLEHLFSMALFEHYLQWHRRS